MKIVFCGPPHSGKTVFVTNLIYRLPTDDHITVRACPDGEGTWSNNKNQNEINLVRKKGKFTKSFIDDACQTIDLQSSKIILVDVGGVISEENEQVFKHCDSFVVLSSDEKKKKEWLEFGEKLGLKCIGCIDSALEGQDEIYSRTPYLQGKIVGLERGENLDESPILDALCSDIVQKSNYSQKETSTTSDSVEPTLDDTDLGFELGYGKEILTENGIAIKKVRWPESAISDIYKYIKEKVNSEQPLKISGVRANFILCAICKAAKMQGVKDISAYDIRSAQYIPIKNLPKKKRLKQTNGLSYNIIENSENVFIDIDITKEKYSLEDYAQCVLPKIKEGKNLYLSGRIPLWLLASICTSYNSNKIFTFQPGKGFTCVSSIDEKDLGTIVDGIDGIDINQYFEDKKNKTKTNLPAVVRKLTIFSNIKSWFSNFRRKSNYINNKIRANSTSQTEIVSENKSDFQKSLQVGTSEEPRTNEQTSLSNIPNIDMHKSN